MLPIRLAAASLFCLGANVAAADALFTGFGESAASASVSGGPEIPAIQLPCSGCHGRDGMGRKDAGEIIPPIHRGQNGLSTSAVSASGVTRPAYDLRSFSLAISKGIGSDGRTLSPRMPRYRISDSEALGLWNYLGGLYEEVRPGVDVGLLVVTIYGSVDAAAAIEHLRDELAAALSGLPASYDLKFQVRTEFEAPDHPEKCPGDGAMVIALASSTSPASLLEAARRCGIPIVAPIFELTGSEQPADVRAISATLLDQWRALRRAAGPVAVVAPTDMSEAERSALKFASLNPVSPQVDQDAVLAPFGLDRLPSGIRAKRIYTTANRSNATLATWVNAGTQVIIADTRFASRGGSPILMRMTPVVASLLQRAAAVAGPDPTRSSLMEAIDSVTLAPDAWPAIDYKEHRLQGSSYVELVTYGP